MPKAALGPIYTNPERRILTNLIKADKVIARSEGCYLYGSDGAAYLDFASQYGAVPFGHNPEFLWLALEQVRAQSAPSLVQPLRAPSAERLAEALISVAPGEARYAVFTNSGAESVEAAIKLARSATQRSVILATDGGFHGKTLGAASATGTPIYRDPFLTDTRAFRHVPFGDVGALERAVSTGDVAAFLVEPVQGEGGMRVPAPGYLKAAQDICRRSQVLFILDEVQTGLGRTGKLFAAEHDDLSPDVLLLAKALGGGLVPLGACLVSERHWTRDFGLYHSSTFANNNLTCAIGLAVLERLTRDDEALVKEVARKGDYLRNGLNDLAQTYPRAFVEASGRGLMQGLRLREWPEEEAYFHGLLNERGYLVPLVSGYLLNAHAILAVPTISHSGVLRIQPPLTIGESEIDRLLGALAQFGKIVHDGAFEELLAPLALDVPSTKRSALKGGRARSSCASAPTPSCKRLGSFAFLVHPTDDEALFDSLPIGCSLLPEPAKESLRAWLDKWRGFDCDPAPIYHARCVPAGRHGYVEGWLICAPLTPREMLRLRREEKRELLGKYMAAARKLGAEVVGLGAFTSVISRGGLDILEDDIPITTGNSLTALSSAASLRAIFQGSDRPPLEQQTVAVVGAAGSVGRLAALDIAPSCRRLVLVGNPQNPGGMSKLKTVAGEILGRLLRQEADDFGSRNPRVAHLRLALEGGRTPDPDAGEQDFADFFEALQARDEVSQLIRLSLDPERDLALANAVISATSQGAAFIAPEWLRADAVVCDAARPSDVAANVAERRPDVLVYEGGLMQLPSPIRFGRANVLGFPDGVNLGCLCETMVLAMAGVAKNYSVGPRIPYREAREVYEMAAHFGFAPHTPSFTPSLEPVEC